MTKLPLDGVSSLTRHKSACRICNHQKLEEINMLIIAQQDKLAIKQFGLRQDTIDRHRAMVCLHADISDTARAYLAKLIGESNTGKIKSPFAKIQLANILLNLGGLLQKADGQANSQIVKLVQDNSVKILLSSRNPRTIKLLDQLQDVVDIEQLPPHTITDGA